MSETVGDDVRVCPDCGEVLEYVGGDSLGGEAVEARVVPVHACVNPNCLSHATDLAPAADPVTGARYTRDV